MHTFFNLAFFQQFFVTVAGVIVGVPLALWINSRQRAAANASITAAKSERQRQLKDALRENVARNSALVAQIERELSQQVIFYNVDLSVLESTAALKYDILDSLPLCKALDKLHYELAHLHRKIDLQMDLAFDATGMTIQLTNGDTFNAASRRAVVLSAFEHIKQFPQFFADVGREFSS